MGTSWIFRKGGILEKGGYDHPYELCVMTLTVLGVTEICSFKLVPEGNISKEILESSRLEFVSCISA